MLTLPAAAGEEVRCERCVSPPLGGRVLGVRVGHFDQYLFPWFHINFTIFTFVFFFGGNTNIKTN